MKRFLALVLTLAIFMGLLAGISFSVKAEGESATVWSPTEITLTSTKKYDNPYKDVKIDAVFTHTDGTQISLPGFWKEGDTFAVRFSPTKAGNWNYKITCSDASNASLTKEGTLNAKENTSENGLQKHGFVKAGDGIFTYDDGTPFFWLGDTHWQSLNYEQNNKCNYPGCNCYNQFKHEVDNRVEKGFTVYQTYFDSSVSDGGGQAGLIESIWEKKSKLPSSEVFNNKVDKMFEYLHEVDMAVALGFGAHRNTVRSMSLTDLKDFARYVVARYACYSILWITGQEITNPEVEAYDPTMFVMDAWLELAKYIDEIDGYKHPNSAHMNVMDLTSMSALTLQKQSWHNWWATQGGHGLGMLPTKKHYMAYCAGGKPVVEAEYNYEDINCGVFTGYEATRIGAWNAMLNGCAGYTYGATGIWANCYSTEGNVGWYDGFTSYNYEPWYMGLDKPGSFEMTYMKNFFMTIKDWSKLVARYEDIRYADFLKDSKKMMSSTEDKTTFVCYFINEDTSTGKIYGLDNTKTYKALWYNVLTGKFIPVSDNVQGVQYDVPEKPTTEDWVFLLTSDELKDYKTEAVYKKPEKQENVGNIVTPYKVTAIGGLEYKNGRLRNKTESLYDLDGRTAWEPHANRVTQTIIYDLGAAYDLTQINIVPATETVLPKYRIECSNDGKNWNIIVNTKLHDFTLSEDKTYSQEPLTGTYRYVKILLLNAEDIPTAQVDKVNYRIVRNNRYFDQTKETACYSYTAIAEISVFASGKAESIPVGQGGNGTTQNGNTPNENNGGITVNILPVAITGVVAIIVIGLAITLKVKKNKQD